MTGRISAAFVSLGLFVGATGCISFVEIPVEIPLQAKLDVSAFQRVLVAGFLAGGSKSIDPNSETARLLRSQLRTKSDMRVVDADVLSLADEVDRMRGRQISAGANRDEPKIKTAKDLEDYEQIFSDKEYWKKLGSQYQNPLIVTGTVLFTEVQKSGMVSKAQAYTDQVTGEQKFQEVKTMSDMKGYALDAKFTFIDGRTGAELHSETIHDESLYPSTQNTPALSSYFEIMDKILPSFLNTLSTQKIRGTRILIK
jgi:hypothetical protein